MPGRQCSWAWMPSSWYDKMRHLSLHCSGGMAIDWTRNWDWKLRSTAFFCPKNVSKFTGWCGSWDSGMRSWVTIVGSKVPFIACMCECARGLVSFPDHARSNRPCWGRANMTGNKTTVKKVVRPKPDWPDRLLWPCPWWRIGGAWNFESKLWNMYICLFPQLGGC